MWCGRQKHLTCSRRREGTRQEFAKAMGTNARIATSYEECTKSLGLWCSKNIVTNHVQKRQHKDSWSGWRNLSFVADRNLAAIQMLRTRAISLRKYYWWRKCVNRLYILLWYCHRHFQISRSRTLPLATNFVVVFFGRSESRRRASALEICNDSFTVLFLLQAWKCHFCSFDELFRVC